MKYEERGERRNYNYNSGVNYSLFIAFTPYTKKEKIIHIEPRLLNINISSAPRNTNGTFKMNFYTKYLRLPITSFTRRILIKLLINNIPVGVSLFF